jgi:hypothetical protein
MFSPRPRRESAIVAAGRDGEVGDFEQIGAASREKPAMRN